MESRGLGIAAGGDGVSHGEGWSGRDVDDHESIIQAGGNGISIVHCQVIGGPGKVDRSDHFDFRWIDDVEEIESMLGE